MSNRLFTSIPVKRKKTNQFNLSHDRKFSMNFGKLTPIYVQEVIPSDSVSIRDEIFVRFAPMVFPVMHRVNVFTHYFFVPNRILWSGFEDFITGNKSGEDVPAAPFIRITSEPESGNLPITVSSLGDYLGLPITYDLAPARANNEALAEGDGTPVSALPFAAYHRIWFEYYRDQNLQAEYEPLELYDGEQDVNDFLEAFAATSQSLDDPDFMLFNRAWTKDYFTSALPWAQKGEEVMLPLGSVSDVNVYYQQPPLPVRTGGRWWTADDSEPFEKDYIASLPLAPGPGVDPRSSIAVSTDGNNNTSVYYDPNSSLKAETSQLEFEAASINNLRRAFRLQEWLEKNARGGTRYVESIQVHFGITPQDSRLQRPEYIGGAMQPVTISEVLSTVGNESRPQGDMAGHGVSVGSSKPIKYFAREHGYIIGIMSIMPVPAYQQGIPRHFSKFDRFDYYWSDFAHIGEQEILNKELVWTADEEHNNETFGYTPRYAEYKYQPSTVHGDFRTNLDLWHMGRIFDRNNPPALNEEFIMMKNEEVDRIFAVQDASVQKLWCHVYHNVKARRPMPKFGIPSF